MKTLNTIYSYPGLLPFEPTEKNADAMMASLAGAGITHVQINHLPDLMHPELLAQPENVYLWFANYGPPLDLYVSSEYNYGLWPEMYLERNQASLKRFAASARKHGIKPILYLCEPRFVPERFFKKNPTLRGPRVDNPTCSTTPLFALCTDMPEVQEHYRQMMARVIEIVPDLAAVSIFTSDSGSGFDYNPHSYCGPNGAAFNRGIPLETRVSNFLTLLLEEGRKKSPEFEVHLTSGFDPEMRAKILAIAPKGVLGSVNGLYDWAGGLEEQWAYHQTMWAPGGPKWNIRNLDREAAFAERFEDMKERLAASTTKGEDPLVHAQLPTTDYPRPLRYTPQPYDVIRVMKAYDELGVKRLTAWGVISPKELVPYDINLAAFQAINEDIGAEPSALLRGIAVSWVGEAYADVLVEAWKICDHAHTRRPNWTIGISKILFPGPLVPDLTALTPAETRYYKTIGLADLERIQGLGGFIPFEADERNRDYVLDELYDKVTIPGLLQAATLLEKAATGSPAEAAVVLRQQAEHIRFAGMFQRTHRNWYEVGQHLVAGVGANPRRPFVEIVDDEIANTRDIISVLEGRVEKFIRCYPTSTMTYEFGDKLVEQLRERIEVMQRHRDDKPLPLGDKLSKVKAHLAALATQVE